MNVNSFDRVQHAEILEQFGLSEYDCSFEDKGNNFQPLLKEGNVHAPLSPVFGETRSWTKSQNLEGRSWLSSFGSDSLARPLFVQAPSESWSEHLLKEKDDTNSVKNVDQEFEVEDMQQCELEDIQPLDFRNSEAASILGGEVPLGTPFFSSSKDVTSSPKKLSHSPSVSGTESAESDSELFVSEVGSQGTPIFPPVQSPAAPPHMSVISSPAKFVHPGSFVLATVAGAPSTFAQESPQAVSPSETAASVSSSTAQGLRSPRDCTHLLDVFPVTFHLMSDPRTTKVIEIFGYFGVSSKNKKAGTLAVYPKIAYTLVSPQVGQTEEIIFTTANKVTLVLKHFQIKNHAVFQFPQILEVGVTIKIGAYESDKLFLLSRLSVKEKRSFYDVYQNKYSLEKCREQLMKCDANYFSPFLEASSTQELLKKKMSSKDDKEAGRKLLLLRKHELRVELGNVRLVRIADYINKDLVGFEKRNNPKRASAKKSLEEEEQQSAESLLVEKAPVTTENRVSEVVAATEPVQQNSVQELPPVVREEISEVPPIPVVREESPKVPSTPVVREEVPKIDESVQTDEDFGSLFFQWMKEQLSKKN